MTFKEMLRPLREGKKVKLPSWEGYWKKDDNEIMMYCHDGRVLNLRNNDDMFWTLENICSTEWEVVEDEEIIEEVEEGEVFDSLFENPMNNTETISLLVGYIAGKLCPDMKHSDKWDELVDIVEDLDDKFQIIINKWN